MIGTYTHRGLDKTVIKCVDYEEIDVSATPVGFTAAKLRASDFVFMTVNGDPIRVTPDGSTPTTTRGILLLMGDNQALGRVEAETLLAVLNAGAASSKIQAAYYKNV